MAIIKYYRDEGKKFIIIPTAAGVEFFEQKKPQLKSDIGTLIPFQKDVEEIAGGKVHAFIVELGSDIKHVSVEDNKPKNEVKIRIFTDSLNNYFLVLPHFAPKDSRF